MSINSDLDFDLDFDLELDEDDTSKEDKKDSIEDLEVISDEEQSDDEELEELEDDSEDLEIIEEHLEIEYETDKSDDDTIENIIVNTDEEDEIYNRELILLTDKPKVGLLTYLRQYGLLVNNIYTSPSEISDLMLTTDSIIDIIIIETGSGKFRPTNMILEISDLLGLADKKCNIDIYYTDGRFKELLLKDISSKTKNITWHEYKYILDVLRNSLIRMEKYDVDNVKIQEQIKTEEELMKFKGLEVDLSSNIRMKIETVGGGSKQYITAIKNMIINEEEEELKSYTVDI